MIRVLAGGSVVLAILGGLLFACDEVYADPITSSFASGFDAGTFTTPKTPPLPCKGEPRENAPCGRQGSVCEIGSSPDPTCNAHLVCASSSFGLSWTEQSRTPCTGVCPEDAAAIVDGAPCDLGPRDAAAGPVRDEEELQCATPAGVCACTTGPDALRAHPRRWVCVPLQPDCPPKRPLLGRACFGARACDYGGCAFKRGMRMICEDEVWQVGSASCD